MPTRLLGFGLGLLVTCTQPLPTTIRRVFALDDDLSPTPLGATGEAGLLVEVEPAQGISIVLDNQKVAQTSPFQRFHLASGHHTLTVRGMGFWPVDVPLVLTDGQTFQLSLALRPRHVDPPTTLAVTPAAPQAAAAPSPPAIGAAVATHAQVAIQWLAQPSLPLWVDGNMVLDNKVLVLRHVSGWLRLGALQLAYSLQPHGQVMLTLPHNIAATYEVDGQALHPGSTFVLAATASRIECMPTWGAAQSLILKPLAPPNAWR